MTSEIKSKKTFHVLDGLRGIAAIVVLFWHMTLISGFVSISASGYLAVDLFFLLSGFVLQHSYADKLRSGMTFIQFARFRLERLYPLYFVGTLFAVIAIVPAIILGVGKDWTFGRLAIAVGEGLFFIPNLTKSLDPRLFPLNGPAWSLFFELIANAVFALVLICRVKYARYILLAISAPFLISTVMSIGKDDGGPLVDTFLAGFPRVMFSFFLGTVIYDFRPHTGKVNNIVACLIFAACCALLLADPGQYRLWYDFACLFVVFPAMILVASKLEMTGWVRNVASFLGITSYAIYATHAPILKAYVNVIDKVVKHPTPVSALGAGLMFLILAVVIAALLDKYYDTPIRRKLATLRNSVYGLKASNKAT